METTKTKHTAGPWTLENWGILTVGASGRGNIAHVLMPIPISDGAGPMADAVAMRAANAHLIAAAPAMLEALKNARKYIAKMEADGIQTVISPAVAGRRIDEVIALAEGR